MFEVKRGDDFVRAPRSSAGHEYCTPNRKHVTISELSAFPKAEKNSLDLLHMADDN